MNALIIEDEFHAAKRLKELLHQQHPQIKILKVIDSIEDSVEWLSEAPAPDLIFMDIQLADGISFEIFNQVEIFTPVIFTTAFDGYMLDAFKTSGIDYLLKPIEEDQLKRAIQKLDTLRKGLQTNLDLGGIQNLLRHLDGNSFRKQFLVKKQNALVPVKVEDISFFYSEDGLTMIQTRQNKSIIDHTLDELEDLLNPDDFFRINRQQILSRSEISKIHPYFNHRLKIDLVKSYSHEFIVSRKRSKAFKNWMNK